MAASRNRRNPPYTAGTGGVAYAAYDLAGVALAALAVPIFPWLWYTGRTAGAAQRLGWTPPTPGIERPVWLHAASVGETLAAVPLVEALRQRDAGAFPLVVSNTTMTGRTVARREIAPEVSTLLPMDALRIVDRVFATARPRMLIVVETEIWPGLLRAAHRAGAPVAVVSGRMSERSVRRYRLLGPLFRTALGFVDTFCMQSEADARRVLSLGIAADRVRVTGNLKAARSPTERPSLGGLEPRPVFVAASTQPGEEDLVIEACSQLWHEAPEVLLVLAPRRPERFDGVAALLERTGVPFQRRSEAETEVRPHTRVFLLDTLGELAGYIGAARAVFVGGTIAPVGGHNVLEPAASAVPVSFGPNLDNVRAAARALVAAGGAVEVRDAGELAVHWKEMLDDAEIARAVGQRAAGVAADRAGAVAATIEQVQTLLGGLR